MLILIDVITEKKLTTCLCIYVFHSSPKVSRLEMLENVKSQMSNWLGGGIASLRKASKSNEPTGETDTIPDSPETDVSIKGSINDAGDEDDSR